MMKDDVTNYLQFFYQDSKSKADMKTSNIKRKISYLYNDLDVRLLKTFGEALRI